MKSYCDDPEVGKPIMVSITGTSVGKAMSDPLLPPKLPAARAEKLGTPFHLDRLLGA
jgi:hypothetical protein